MSYVSEKNGRPVLQHKSELVAAIRSFARTRGVGLEDEYGHENYAPMRGEVLLAGAFGDWLESRTDIMDDPHQSITVYLDTLLQWAHEDFRTLPAWAGLRSAYVAECEHDREIPDVVGCGTYSQLTAYSAQRLYPLLVNSPWLGGRLECHFGARMQVVDQSWRSFARVAYAPLIARIRQETHRGNAGDLGNTHVMTWAGMGRVMITFRGRRSRDQDDDQVSAVCDDGDLVGIRSGLNFPGCKFTRAVDLIDEATAHWDLGKIRPDKKVSFCGL